jgi:hypothetical protein
MSRPYAGHHTDGAKPGVQAEAVGQALVHFQARLRTLVCVAHLLFVVSTHAQPASAGEAVTCPGSAATVLGANTADFQDVCAGVASTLQFLATFGVTPTEPVAIEVTTSIPPEAGPSAAGCYIEQRRRVYVVPYSSFRKNKSWFNVPIARPLYRALAAHEAAHAVGACNFKVPNPTIQAKEYLAYVTMFSVMPAELRSRALRSTKTKGFESLDRFTPLLYSFDPMRFGAEAYRHFSQVPDQTALIRDVLAGRVLRD